MSQLAIIESISDDVNVWTPEEAAFAESIGLVKRQGPNMVPAPRATINAFLHQCRRTQLDPVARQIYCIERGGKYGIQVSIDGARLVAERTGAYQGQTATQWTADGVTWVDVWLDPATPPAAARVGVYREGFLDAVYGVAVFASYSVASPTWKKMPEVMIAKCAEMLALRKAFPQDLSGLYSVEEMEQAGPGTVAAAAPTPQPVEAAPVEPDPGYVAPEPTPAQPEPLVAAPESAASIDSARLYKLTMALESAGSVEEVRKLYDYAESQMMLHLAVPGDAEIPTVKALIFSYRDRFNSSAPQQPAFEAPPAAEAGPAFEAPPAGAPEPWAVAVPGSPGETTQALDGVEDGNETVYDGGGES